MVALGAGRKVSTDNVNHDVSLYFPYSPNEILKEGDVIARIYHPDPNVFETIDLNLLFNEAIEFS